MRYLKLHNSISKVCVLIAATLILPVLADATLIFPILADADHDSEKGNKGDNDRQRWGEKDELRWGDRDRDKDLDFQPVGFHVSAVLPDLTGVFSMSAPPARLPDAPRIASFRSSSIDKDTPTVPEGGPGMVLLATTVGAILLFSARRSPTALRKP
jgi:hypothetical protein